MNDGELRNEINKRLTLNWLIQGAAQHAGMTFHHLVRDELDAIDPRLLRLYDQYALINLLQYWKADFALLCGWPPRFWRRAASHRDHPFFAHPLLSAFGGMLAASGRTRALERCKDKGLLRVPVLSTYQMIFAVGQLRLLETPHRPRLTELAKRTASTVWGIPVDRLDGELAAKTSLGKPAPARTVRGAILRSMTVGLGGVVQRGDTLAVVGRGTNWQLLTKELVKGTAELICLHGLNGLGDDDYRRVVEATDWIEYEPWMLQTGGELWRRLLAVIPDGRPVGGVLMHLARLPPRSLESLVRAVIEQPQWARELLVGLGDGPEPH